MKLIEALEPVHVRQQGGYVKPGPADIAAAREHAVKSSEYHKLLALSGFQDTSTPQQIKNGTIHFLIHGHLWAQCTATLKCRFQGPDDHTSRDIPVPDNVAKLPLPEAYIELLNVLFDKFKGFGKDHDISVNNEDLYFDMHRGNIMIRGSQPVITDPFCASADAEDYQRGKGVLFMNHLGTNIDVIADQFQRGKFATTSLKTGARPPLKK